MADYLILKQIDGDVWELTARVLNVAATNQVEAARQGYTGPGRYAAVDWSGRTEFDMSPGPVKVAAATGPPPLTAK